MTNQAEQTEKTIDGTKEAYFTELFKSQQGEARFAGLPQIFLRFNSGCYSPDGKYGFQYTEPIFCRFCDEPQGSGKYRKHCRIETTPNQRDFRVVANPISFDEMAQYILDLGVDDVHSISLTGGEPTAFPDGIRALHNRLKGKIKFYLETNGIRPFELEEIIDCIDFVVPDIKVASVTGKSYMHLHKEFLDVCQKYRKHTTCKAVFSAKMTDQEIDEIIALVQPYFADPDFDFELTLQPVTPYGAIGQSLVPSIDKQFEVQQKFWRAGCPVRVLPQTHKLTGHI